MYWERKDRLERPAARIKEDSELLHLICYEDRQATPLSVKPNLAGGGEAIPLTPSYQPTCDGNRQAGTLHVYSQLLRSVRWHEESACF